MPQQPERLHCLEVWGGNSEADRGVIMPGIDAWVFSRPFGQSADGGDVYYVSSCATGRITRFLLADVSGHGRAVAEVAVALRRLMRRFVNTIDQTELVESVNDRFVELSRDERFATALVATLFSPTNDLTLCTAGHPPPLLYRARTRRWELIDARQFERGGPAGGDNLPLGIIDNARYDQFALRLGVGDIVLCYTDGLSEARGRDGELLEAAGLLEIVRGLDPLQPDALLQRLLDTVAELHAGNLTGDDVTVLMFRPNALAPAVPLRDRLLAPFRIAASFVRSRRIGDEPMGWPELRIDALGGALFGPLNALWTRRNLRTQRRARAAEPSENGAGAKSPPMRADEPSVIS